MEKIDLEDMNFMSTLSFKKFEAIAPFISDKKCRFVELWQNYGELGDVAIYEIEGYGKIAYGQFGRVEVGHLDIETLKYVNPKYCWPNHQFDYGWMMGLAIYNRFYTKNGKSYLDYVEDVTLSALCNRQFNSKEEALSVNQISHQLSQNFKQLKEFYNKTLETIGDQMLTAEVNNEGPSNIFFILN